MRFNDGKKKSIAGTKRGQSILSRTREGAETRIAVHYKRQTHKPVEYERPQFSPRNAPRALLTNATVKVSTPGLPTTAENFATEKEPRTFAKLDVENEKPRPHVRASKCTCCYVRRIRQESTCCAKTGESNAARVHGIVEQLACIGIFSDTKMPSVKYNAILLFS